MLLLIATALATQVSPENMVCPLDPSDSVRVYHRASSNTHGGWDSDLAQYSSQGQWREYAIATCADSLFTLYGVDMVQELSAEQITQLQGRLAEIRPMLPQDPTQLQTWDRYLIAVEMYRVLAAIRASCTSSTWRPVGSRGTAPWASTWASRGR